ncbi:MAG: phenylalanine--tRNA ligase subunit beta [Syntrophales bacterium]
MLVSLRWLRDYVDITLGPKELSEKLTMAGLEVDEVREVGPGFEGVVVGRVVSVRPHPNADKLSLCEVSTGDRQYPVVCGAPNVRAGILAPFARVGATIPGGYTIRSSKIRAEQSEGMLCSESELGIGGDATGIMILPENLRPGDDLASALDLKDVVLDIGVTPNRSDCLSIIGIAREVAALTGEKLKHPEIRLEEKGEDIFRMTSVDILDPDLCPRYTARIIKGVKIAPSPLWMRLRLEAVGLRSINNVVDVTNFVMMEYGQPLHAFDYNLLEEGRIVVRRAREAEEFVSLDGKTRILAADTLMICDGVKPVAVAGIMGGMNSEVKDETDTILLESAYFNPSSIRGTSRRLGMGTDAAFRFERGIDPEGVVRALHRAAQLIADLSGGSVCTGYIDQYPLKIKSPAGIPLRTERVRDILGIAIDRVEVEGLLKSLEMTVEPAGRALMVTPPTFRVDISMETDLVEEVARLYGYDRIPETLPQINVLPDIWDRKRAAEAVIRNILTGAGYSEVVNYSFTSPACVDILNIAENDERRQFVKILNPLSEDLSVMRTTLVYGLLETVKRNANIGHTDLRIFEKGKIFIGRDRNELPLEKEKLACLITGLRYDELWNPKGDSMDFYDLKGCIEDLLEGLRVGAAGFISGIEEPFLHPGRSCLISAGQSSIGFLGEIHPDIMDKMDLKGRIIVFEIDFDFLAERFNETVAVRDISRFPPTLRDVAFVVETDLEAEKILGAARGKGEELLEKIEIFDVYRGKSIPDGMKSLALRFTYRSAEKTLTDDEINHVHAGIVKRIVETTGARIRGENIK